MEAEYAAAYARLYREHWWWRVRERIVLQKIREIRAGRPAARILDVGCGAGLFFDALERFGDIQGVEADAVSVEQSGRWRRCIHVGQLDDSFQPGHSFDLILFLDVLEHIDRPEEVLRRAADLLSSGGSILATVPAFDWLWTSHDDLNHHLRRYTAPAMRTMLTRAGLTAIETRYLFQSLVVPKLAVRMRETLTSSAPRIPRIPAPLVNSALQAWYRSEHVIAGRLPFGGSVMAVARRA